MFFKRSHGAGRSSDLTCLHHDSDDCSALLSFLFKNAYLFIFCVCVCTTAHTWSQRTACGSWFSPIIWFHPGVEFRSSSLAASALVCVELALWYCSYFLIPIHLLSNQVFHRFKLASWIKVSLPNFSLLLRPKGCMNFAFFKSSHRSRGYIHVVEYTGDPMNGMKAAAFFQGKYHSPLLHACVDLRVAALWLCICRYWLWGL